MPGSGGQARRAASNISAPPDAPQRELQHAAALGERVEITGRKARRLKATLYAGGFTLDVGIVLAGQPKARAVITLEANEVRELSARLDTLADVMDVNEARWLAERRAAERREAA